MDEDKKLKLNGSIDVTIKTVQVNQLIDKIRDKQDCFKLLKDNSKYISINLVTISVQYYLLSYLFCHIRFLRVLHSGK